MEELDLPHAPGEVAEEEGRRLLVVPDVGAVHRATAGVVATAFERVEAAIGPQGTLWGKNANAGAINFISKKPSFTPEG